MWCLQNTSSKVCRCLNVTFFNFRVNLNYCSSGHQQDFFLIGMIFCEIGSHPFINHELTEEIKINSCYECEDTTFKRCDACAKMFCDGCFERSHKSFKAFRDHKLIDCSAKHDSREPEPTCCLHKDVRVDYCDSCSAFICKVCSPLHAHHTLRLKGDEVRKILAHTHF